MTVFNWLEEITVKKTPPNNFTQQDWDDWNSYMVHRFLSMNISYIDIVNLVQNINPQNKKEIYTIYREMIPKRKIWNKYIKNQNKKDLKELAKAANEISETEVLMKKNSQIRNDIVIKDLLIKLTM